MGIILERKIEGESVTRKTAMKMIVKTINRCLSQVKNIQIFIWG